MSTVFKVGVQEKLQSVEDELIVRKKLVADQETRVEEELKKLEDLRAELEKLKEYKEQLLVEVSGSVLCT